MKRKIELGEIVETIFLHGFNSISSDNHDLLMNYICAFCIDREANVRKGQGLISTGESDYYDPDYVPNVRYDINPCHWKAHSEYVEINLPNPAVNLEYYQKIRSAFIAEIEKRLTVDLRKLKGMRNGQ